MCYFEFSIFYLGLQQIFGIPFYSMEGSKAATVASSESMNVFNRFSLVIHLLIGNLCVFVLGLYIALHFPWMLITCQPFCRKQWEVCASIVYLCLQH